MWEEGSFIIVGFVIAFMVFAVLKRNELNEWLLKNQNRGPTRAATATSVSEKKVHEQAGEIGVEAVGCALSEVTSVAKRKSQKEFTSQVNEQSEELGVEARKEAKDNSQRLEDAPDEGFSLKGRIIFVAAVIIVAWLFFPQFRESFFGDSKPEVRVEKKTFWILYLVQGQVVGTFGPFKETNMAQCEERIKSAKEIASGMVETKRLIESGVISYRCIESENPPT
jgi:hypothetical protein